MPDSISHTIHVEGGAQPVFDVAASNPVSRDVPPCVLTIFGATGDLAYKKIFPSLYHMVRRNTLDVPVIGVAKSGWTLEQLRERARESVCKLM